MDDRRTIVKRHFPRENHLVSFLELMELHFVKMFREQGVSLATIQRASQSAARKFNTEYPLAVKRFDTDGSAIFATLMEQNEDCNDKVLIEDLAKGQYVFENVVKPFFRKIEYQNEAIRYWPLEPKGRIVLDPQRSFGKPMDAETGVPTHIIFDAFRAGGGQDRKTIAAWLDIPLKAVDAAIEFELSFAA